MLKHTIISSIGDANTVLSSLENQKLFIPLLPLFIFLLREKLRKYFYPELYINATALVTTELFRGVPREFEGGTTHPESESICWVTSLHSGTIDRHAVLAKVGSKKTSMHITTPKHLLFLAFGLVVSAFDFAQGTMQFIELLEFGILNALYILHTF